MASKKKDGGAARASGRQRVANKRAEQKYGLQGFTRQAETNLRNNPRYIPTARQSGMGIIQASGFGTTVGVAQAATRAIRGGRSAVQRTFFGVHGSPTTGLRSISPRIGSSTGATNRAARGAGYKVPDSPVAYSYPATPANVSNAQGYSRGQSVYVVKTPTRNVSTPAWNTAERYSTKSLRVVKEINASKPEAQIAKEALKAIKIEKAKTFVSGAKKAVKRGSGSVRKK